MSSSDNDVAFNHSSKLNIMG